MVQFRRFVLLLALLAVILGASPADAIFRRRRRRTVHTAATSNISWSRHSNLSNALPLNGARVSGRVFIFVSASAATTTRRGGLFRRRRRTAAVGIKAVQFWLDRAATGAPDRTDASKPFLLGKGAGGAFAASRLSIGKHTLNVKSIGVNGAVSAPFSATFQVVKGQPGTPKPNPKPPVSTRSCRSRFGAGRLRKRCPNGKIVYRKRSLNCAFERCHAAGDNDYSHRRCNPNDPDYNPNARNCGGLNGPRRRGCKDQLFRCPNLGYVKRNRRDNCRFDPCPRTPAPMRCSAESRRCPSGATVYRDPYRNCQFPSCAIHGVKNGANGPAQPPTTTVCPIDLQTCTNGQAFARSPELNCAFPACPGGTVVNQVNNPCTARFPQNMQHTCPNGAIVTRMAPTCTFPLCSTVTNVAPQARTGNIAPQARGGVAPTASKPSSCSSANDGSCLGGGCPSGSTCCQNICYADESKDSKFPVVWIIVIAAVVLFGVVGAIAVCGKSSSTMPMGPMGGYVGGMEYHRNPVTL